MSGGSEPVSLEVKLKRLETIVSSLEREDVELEEALRLFEEGMAHLRAAQDLIRSAELRIERLVDEGARETATEEENGEPRRE